MHINLLEINALFIYYFPQITAVQTSMITKTKKVKPSHHAKTRDKYKQTLKISTFSFHVSSACPFSRKFIPNCAGMASFVGDDCLHELLSIERDKKKKTLVFIFNFFFFFENSVISYNK